MRNRSAQLGILSARGWDWMLRCQGLDGGFIDHGDEVSEDVPVSAASRHGYNRPTSFVVGAVDV